MKKCRLDQKQFLICEVLQLKVVPAFRRNLAYVATKPGHHGHPTLSLGDFKKADVNYNRKIGARSGMDCVEQAVRTAANLLGLSLSCSQDEVASYLRSKVFSATEGLDVKEAKRLVDWFMARGFSIDRSVYNKSYMRNRPVGKDKMAYTCGILDDNGPGVYVIYTSDVSLLGHYWTVHVFYGIAFVASEDPPCAITDMKDYIHHVHFIRKCIKKARSWIQQHSYHDKLWLLDLTDKIPLSQM
ncbi:hypothetical protein DYB30_013852 [Aphanomyces astaci]|uniref:Uncharacterized protein n=1 Tax=Aphanomyces astaci TaxID=112090 RepID=A0A397CWZ6_APHAT|nr:hypothetical protein DYB38_013707 [Aphanomyces astaci]RHY51563.1 hypothetical protein DYB30_013852 [Aphanomyces astaci]RHZ23235.1 hypothetical protein DYB31_006127 [Aphanomyces astaci]